MTSCPGCGAPYETPCSYCGARRCVDNPRPTMRRREITQAEANDLAVRLRAREWATLDPWTQMQQAPPMTAQQQYALMQAQTMEAPSVGKCIGNAFGMIFGGLR